MAHKQKMCMQMQPKQTRPTFGNAGSSWKSFGRRSSWVSSGAVVARRCQCVVSGQSQTMEPYPTQQRWRKAAVPESLWSDSWEIKRLFTESYASLAAVRVMGFNLTPQYASFLSVGQQSIPIT